MLTAIKERALRYMTHLMVSLVMPPVFYQHMGHVSVRKNFLGIALIFLFIMLMNMVSLGLSAAPIAVLFVLTVLLVTSPYFFLASVFDPLMAYLRGETEKPWTMLARNFALHIWPVTMALALISIGLNVFIVFGGELPSPDEDTGSVTNLQYVVFVLIVGLHQFFAMKYTPDVRKAQKVITGIVFTMLFLSMPVVNLFL